MSSGKKVLHIIIWLGVVILQFLMILILTFIITLAFPSLERYPENHPIVFLIILGLSFTTGAFSVGWVVIKLHWLKEAGRLSNRLFWTIIGAYLPLIVAYSLVHPLGSNPYYFISMITSIIGFHIPTWWNKE